MTNQEPANTWEPVHRVSSVVQIGAFIVPVVGGIGLAIWANLSGLASPVIAVVGLVAVAALLGSIRAALSVYDRISRGKAPSRAMDDTPRKSLANSRSAADRALGHADGVRAAEARLQPLLATALRERDSARHDAVELGEKLAQKQSDSVSWQQQFYDMERMHDSAVKAAEAERHESDGVVSRLHSTIDEGKAHSRRWFWQAQYGMPHPELPAMSESDLRSVSPHLDLCVAAALRAGKRLDEALRSIAERLDGQGEPSCGFYLRDFVEEHVRVRLNRSAGLLEESRADPRDALLTFYERYNSARLWVERALNCLLVDPQNPIQHTPLTVGGRAAVLLSAISGYKDWWRADGAFFAELDRVRAIGLLEHVDGAIRNVNVEHHYPSSLRADMDPDAWPR